MAWTSGMKRLVDRRARMRPALGQAGRHFSERHAGDGKVMFRHACKLELEGIVSKRAMRVSGRCKVWIKVNRDSSRCQAG